MQLRLKMQLRLTWFVLVLFAVGIMSISIIGCGNDEEEAQLFDDSAANLGLAFDSPATSSRPIPSFKTDISPILTQRCALAGCHVADGEEGVDLRTYATLQKGGANGAIVIAGNARESDLVVEVVTGEMPPDGSPLEASEMQRIIDWINNGAKDD